jgi:seryl-tRNA synthetase
MLDPSLVRERLDEVRRGLRNRGLEPDKELEQLATLEARRRRVIPELEGLKREQNAAGDEVAKAKRQGKDASDLFAASKQRGQRIRQLEIELDQIEHQRSGTRPCQSEPRATGTSRSAGMVSRRALIFR